jgi:hypothetical protein
MDAFICGHPQETPMSTKYTPKSCLLPKLELLTTPNKNIQSQFMRSDVSYCVCEQHRFHSYRTDEPIIQAIVANNRLTVEGSSVDLDGLFLLTSFNTNKFSTLQEAEEELRKRVAPLLEGLEIQPSGSFLSLVFHDLLNRTEVLALCGLFLNVLSFRGLMLMPYSLSLAIGMAASNCIVVSVHEDYATASFIDDFWVIDSFCIGKGSNLGFVLCDSEDFVDEFNRMRGYDENSIFVCRACDHRDDSYSKIEEHMKSTHGGGDPRDIFEYRGVCGDLYEAVADRMILLFNKEKMKRIGGRILVVRHCEKIFDEEELAAAMKGIDVECKVVYPEDVENVILSGMATFSELDCAKDLWMTDKEWNSVGLRVLKEKVLFLI